MSTRFVDSQRSPAAAGGERFPFPQCERLYQALTDCHRRVPAGPSREAACRHLNRSLARCLVENASCPDEYEAFRSLCSSAGTALKRKQCQQAQLSLADCLSAHQLQS